MTVSGNLTLIFSGNHITKNLSLHELDDGRLTKNGKTLVSGIDPHGRAVKIIDAVTVRDRTLYFCPSPIYGHGLFRLLTRLESEAPGSAVLCIECDCELYEFSKKKIETEVTDNKRLHFTNICDSASLSSLVKKIWGARAFRRIETIRLSGGWQLSHQLYDSLFDYLRCEITADWSNSLTLAKLGRLYIRNTLRNLVFASHFSPITDLSFGSSPVLVLGAGPSLDEILDVLISCFPDISGLSGQKCEKTQINSKRPFKIICVDTCIGALKDRNIIPDLIVILESQHWNLRDFIGCRGWNVCSAIDLSSLPESLHMLSGRNFVFITPWTQLEIFKRLGEAGLLPVNLPPLGSVGLTAVELARQISSGKIICAGLDFSFTADKYHARGTPGHRSRLNTQNRFRSLFNTQAYATHSFSAVSKSGFSVFSDPALRGYRNLFEQEFANDSRVFDIEGSGLPLGLKTLTMEEAMNVLGITSDYVHEKYHKYKNEAVFNDRCRYNSYVPSINNGSLYPGGIDSRVKLFFECEKIRLSELKEILTGDTQMNKDRLLCLINECDYLWAHFPDYSGGRFPDLNDISFLKRLRMEIDPMLKLIKQQILKTGNS